jgi:hypothetical protein
MNINDIYTYFGYAIIAVLIYLIYRTLFPNKELEGLMGLFEDKNDAKTTTTEENNNDDPAVKRIEENVKELEDATNKAISQMSLVKYRSHWENLIIAMEDRISSASLQSLSALSVMINKNPSDSKIVTVMEKLNSFDKFRATLKGNMKYLDGLK